MHRQTDTSTRTVDSTELRMQTNRRGKEEGKGENDKEERASDVSIKRAHEM